MNKTLKKTLLIAGITVAVCAAVWGGLTLARNAQRGDVNVYQVSDFAMTDYWGDTANTSGTVNTDKLQKLYISETQEVSAIYVKEGQNVKKGDKLLAYDSSLSQAQVEQAEIDLDTAQLNAKAAKQNLELYKIAEDKEKLQIEYDTQYAKLEALIQAQDKVDAAVLSDAGGQRHAGVLPDGRVHPHEDPQAPHQRLCGAGGEGGQREQRRRHLLRYVPCGR